MLTLKRKLTAKCELRYREEYVLLCVQFERRRTHIELYALDNSIYFHIGSLLSISLSLVFRRYIWRSRRGLTRFSLSAERKQIWRSTWVRVRGSELHEAGNERMRARPRWPAAAQWSVSALIPFESKRNADREREREKKLYISRSSCLAAASVEREDKKRELPRVTLMGIFSLQLLYIVCMCMPDYMASRLCLLCLIIPARQEFVPSLLHARDESNARCTYRAYDIDDRRSDDRIYNDPRGSRRQSSHEHDA